MINSRLFFILLLINVVLFANNSYAQYSNNKDYSLKLTLSQLDKKNVRQRLFVVNEIPKEADYKHIPSGFAAISLVYFSFDPDQMLYQKYLEGKRSKEDWEANLKTFTSGKPVLSSKPVLKNDIGIFTGLDKKGNKTIIVDANNNRDFGDDLEYNVGKDQADTVYKISLAGSYFNGRAITDTVFSMLMIPSTNLILNDDTLRQRLGISFVNDAILSAKINADGNTYRFTVSKPLVPNRSLQGPTLVFVAQFDSSGRELNTTIHELNDSIRINKDSYQLKEVNFNTQILKMTFLGREVNNGTDIGDVVYNFKAQDIITAKTISPNQFNGKYILLDFWGSWCIPCIKGIPDLVKLSKNYQDKLHIISIANDKKQDLQKVKMLIATNNMDWGNVWNEYNTGELVRRFKVSTFPTYILVDQQGKIIARNEGAFFLTSIKSLIN